MKKETFLKALQLIREIGKMHCLIGQIKSGKYTITNALHGSNIPVQDAVKKLENEIKKREDEFDKLNDENI